MRGILGAVSSRRALSDRARTANSFLQGTPAGSFDRLLAPSERAGHLTHLDPRAPFVVDMRDLPRRPGSMRRVSRTVSAPADLSGELVRVPAGGDLGIDVRLESVREGVLVSGTVRAPLTGECARCLEPLTAEMEVGLQQLYAYPGHEVGTDDDEIGRVVDDYIDLEPLVRDAVVLALPLAPVCREDCAGLCPRCGARLADAEPGHRHDDVDPRWAALHELQAMPESREDDASRTSAKQ